MRRSSGTSFGHVCLAIHLFLPFLLILCVYSSPKLLPAVALLWAEAICQCGQHECVCVCEKAPYCTSFHHGLCNGKGLQVTICQKVYRRTHIHNHHCLFFWSRTLCVHSGGLVQKPEMGQQTHFPFVPMRSFLSFGWRRKHDNKQPYVHRSGKSISVQGGGGVGEM